MNISKGQALEVFLFLSSSGTGVPGLLFSDVVLHWWKHGLGNVPVRPILTEEWVELGNGYYVFTLPAVDVDQLGELYMNFTGTGFDPVKKEYFVEPTSIAFLATTAGCIISGNTLDLAGRLLAGKQVVFRPVDAPNAMAGSLISFERIVTFTDALGNFSVNLLRGATAIVEIQDAGL